MNKNFKKIIALGIIILLLAIIAALIFEQRKINSRKVTQLNNVEVREYKGEKLSSVDAVVDQGIVGIQNIDVKNYSLAITGLVNQPEQFTYDQALKLPKYSKVVDLNCVEGWSAKILWEGILVKDLLAPAGVKPEANTVILYAADGYTTSLPLDYIENNNIMLAYKMNGLVLTPAKGFPFQLVAENKWGYKWIKWVTKIELSSDPNYRGYWESNGYNNNGDLNGPKGENQ